MINNTISDNNNNPADLMLLNRIGEGVAVLTLNSPPLNLFSLETTRALDWRLREIANDQHIRCLVVTGAGDKCFAAGSDVKEFPELIESNTVIERKLSFEMEVHERLQNLPQPTIAAINGMALGGGMELALCCDLRIIAENAYIGFPEIKLGVYAGTAATLLPNLIGESRTKELFYLGKKIDAKEAYLIGIVNQVVPEKDVLEKACEIAKEIASSPLGAQKIIKEIIKMMRTPGVTQGEKIEMCLNLSKKAFASQDTREAIDAFLEKRKPIFRHQ